MFDIFSRHSLVYQAKQHGYYSSKKNFTQDIRQYAPNFKHKDGRIYASKDGEPYWVVTVSPYHPRFKTQIEDGVWPIVEPLINKNYLTVSSCEGHGSDQKLIVTLVFETLDDANQFVNNCSSVPNWHFRLHSAERKIHNTVKSGTSVMSEETIVALNENFEEFKRYNLLFFRNYKQYVYLDMILYKFPKPIWKRLFRRFILRRPVPEFYINRDRMVEFLNNHLPVNHN